MEINGTSVYTNVSNNIMKKTFIFLVIILIGFLLCNCEFYYDHECDYFGGLKDLDTLRSSDDYKWIPENVKDTLYYTDSFGRTIKFLPGIFSYTYFEKRGGYELSCREWKAVIEQKEIIINSIDSKFQIIYSITPFPNDECLNCNDDEISIAINDIENKLNISLIHDRFGSNYEYGTYEIGDIKRWAYYVESELMSFYFYNNIGIIAFSDRESNLWFLKE